MKINLDLLKFHSFKKDKILTNENVNQEKNPDFYLGVWKKFFEMINILKQNSYSEMVSMLKSNHILKGEKFMLVISVIETCHPKLSLELDQRFFEREKDFKSIKFFQFKITNGIRIVSYYDYKTETLFPLLFDLNHCFHNDEKYNKGIKSKYPWDFKNKQNYLKTQFTTN